MGKRVNQANFERVELLENQFEDRYGRKSEVMRAITLGEGGLIEHVTIHIKEDNENYTIQEYLKKDQTTDYVLSGKDGDPRKYNDYLQAEVYVADLIGERKRLKRANKNGNIK